MSTDLSLVIDEASTIWFQLASANQAEISIVIGGHNIQSLFDHSESDVSLVIDDADIGGQLAHGTLLALVGLIELFYCCWCWSVNRQSKIGQVLTRIDHQIQPPEQIPNDRP